MKRTAAIAILVIRALHTSAQWDVPTSVVLTGATDAERQVTGLATPATPTSGVSAITDRSLSTTMAVATGTDQLTLDLQPAIAAYSAGMQVTFVPQNTNNGAVSLDVNGLGSLAVVKDAGQPLDSADLRPGVPVTVVHDGSAFQIISQVVPGCPAGFMAASRDYCIEVQSSDSINWYAANSLCWSRNARLCTFGEWYHACAMAGGILPSVVAYEWVDSAANDTNKAKRVGQNSTLTIGCNLGGPAVPLTLTRFRCCYDR